MRYNPYTRHFWDILIILLVVYVENIPTCAAISSQGFEFRLTYVSFGWFGVYVYLKIE